VGVIVKKGYGASPDQGHILALLFWKYLLVINLQANFALFRAVKIHAYSKDPQDRIQFFSNF